ncbi:MAG TPA: YSC84-related protein [Candidatus Brocadiaceae bacterium]|nr:YSC84-related protein [Candidatus Brocadiaceae bacterium]
MQYRFVRFLQAFVLLTGIVFALGTVLPNQVFAKSAKEIDVSVEAALERFRTEVKGSEEFLKSAKGVLILPGVIKGGLVIGGEYGEGALMIDGKTVDYYSTAAASYGFQLGGQKKDIILIFMQEDALKGFRNSSGWKAGVDGSVALVTIGAGSSIDTAKINEPIVGFVFGQKGLMYNLTLEGSKFTKLKR